MPRLLLSTRSPPDCAFFKDLSTADCFAHHTPNSHCTQCSSLGKQLPYTASEQCGFLPLAVGRSATHTVVFAQLYIKGKCYGVHPFIVQIRSLHDHSPAPGKVALQPFPPQMPIWMVGSCPGQCYR